jgi:hypothetical protein
LKWKGLQARFCLETVILSLSKDDVLSKTALFDRLRVLVLLTTVVVLRRIAEAKPPNPVKGGFLISEIFVDL